MKSVLVTGASRGIGRFLYGELSSEYEMIGLARTVPDDVSGPFVQADVSQAESLAKALRGVDLRRLYGLINCAGIASMNLFLTTPLDTARRVLEVNALGTMNACRLALPPMIRQREGRIINFSTVAVELGLEGEAAYVASKAAVEAFSRVLAKEVGPYNITVNTVCPGPIKTDLIRSVDAGTISRLTERLAIPRLTEFGDVLNAVRFYLDKRSSMVTGQRVVLGGT